MTDDETIAIQPSGAIRDLLEAQRARIKELEISRANWARKADDFEALSNKQRRDIQALFQRLDGARETCAELQEACEIEYSHMLQAEHERSLCRSGGRKLAFFVRSFWQLYQDKLMECDKLHAQMQAWAACCAAAGWDREVGN